MYYVPRVAPMSELAHPGFKTNSIYAEGFLQDGQVIMIPDLQPALKMLQNQQVIDGVFEDWRPILRPIGILTQCDSNVPAQAHKLESHELIPIGMEDCVASIFFGENVYPNVANINVYMEDDILHESNYWIFEQDKSGAVSIAPAARAAEARMSSVNLLADALYRMPETARHQFVELISNQYSNPQYNPKELPALQMALSSDKLQRQSGLPTTEDLMNGQLKTIAMKGFVQESPYGLDFGMRLLQKFEKQLTWELSADALTKLPELHQLYQNTLQRTGVNPEACVDALMYAALNWGWKLESQHDVIAENIDTLENLADTVLQDMERPFDKMLSEILQSTPAQYQCAMKIAIMEHVQYEQYEGKHPDIPQMTAALQEAVKYAATECALPENVLHNLEEKLGIKHAPSQERVEEPIFLDDPELPTHDDEPSKDD